jgi:hypothetical protein
MTTQYFLLNPVTADSFDIAHEEFLEAVEEFGCSTYQTLTNLNDETQIVYYITANTRAALERLVLDVDLDGDIIEVTGIWENIWKDTWEDNWESVTK